MFTVTKEHVKAAKTLIEGHENQLVARMTSTLPNDLVPVHTSVTLMLDAFAEKYPEHFVRQVCAFVCEEVVDE